MKLLRKRIFLSSISFAFLLALILSTFYIRTVHATNEPKIQFGEVTGKIGEEVIVPVTITDNPGIATFRFRVSYDTEGLTFLSAEKGELLSSGTLDSKTDAEDKTLTFLWYSVSNVVGDGEITRLKFKISEAAKGEYPLSVIYLEEDLLNEDGIRVPYTVQEGKIATGVICSGNITSFNSNTDTITVNLYEKTGNTLSYTTTTRGNSATYSIEGVSPGTYIMKVSKDKHVTREYTIVVGTESVPHDVKIHLRGDVNTDGRVDYGDIQRLYQHVSTHNKVKGYSLLIANVNEDNSINYGDIQRLYQHISGANKLF